MSNQLKDIQNTVVFIDNIYMAGRNLQDLYDTVVQVLTKLELCDFKLKIEKCKLFTKYIDVFGFRINKYGMSVIKSNLKPLLNAPAPTNLTMLKSFLGKVNYYSRFLNNMATALTPLYECTKRGKFKWTKECQFAFELIKNKLANTENLKHFNPEQPIIITCDASQSGLAAILSNRDEKGVIKPVAYASKKLNSTEIKYAAIDKEAMAIVFGITKFYNYIYGRSFELETDSSALVRIFGPTKGIPKMAAKRLQHYAIFLSAFKYKIRHIKTSINPADFLSRTPELLQEDGLMLHSLCLNGNVTNVIQIHNSKIDHLNWKIIQNKTKVDETLSKVLRYCMDGWPEKSLITPDLLPYYNRKIEINIDRGCLFWGHRIIIPGPIRQAVMQSLHESHFGIVRMKELARSYFWWPNLDSQIENVTKSCLICLTNFKNPPKVEKPWPVPPSPWYRLHADFLGPFYKKMYLVVVDSYTKWPEVFEMGNMTATKTIDILETLFSRYGYPVHLVTDNQTTFAGLEFATYCEKNNIKHTFTPPYHPATNGAAERFVETFKTTVTKIKETGTAVGTAIQLFLFDYRSTPQRTTGISPARLMLGRELRNRFSILRPPPLVDSLIDKQTQKGEGRRDGYFIVGQKVMVRDYRKGCKPWILGIIIAESVPGLTYKVDVLGMTWKRHVNQMLSCNESIEESTT
ncbi:uncharacterized protein K02A2.6-like isoform X1 [Pectinophora gossypiella]|uniref:uncharacterized protein K02A2.6-like isoform X1 n=1 Tax=Pectinophora gossypiella TaxID=13191 RepID=UPI00214ECB5E|nr:uncharacterized protein K02A2.6-like isoform X1 [Pectinophora gossypiella]XP_049865698.1 uncharacterized protein K02A2.6-like isoform X1 [Pectinophora gossypiella]